MSLKILIIDDEEEICRSLSEFFEYYGYSCRHSCHPERLDYEWKSYKPDVILLDLRMSKMDGIEVILRLNHSGKEIPFIIISGHASIRDTVQVMKLGAMNLYPKPVEMDTLLSEIRGIESKLKLRESLDYDSDDPDSSELSEAILTQDPLMLRILNMAKEAARTDAIVLIQGESGTGKELIASTIHRNSSCKNGPFIKVNCAAIMKSLLESEIFGHEKGAFTGALQRKTGLFEQAEKGSLFLDEIGDMALESQAKMLRVLQDKQYTRIGGTGVLNSDCRIIAATNKNLESEILAGRFREDLYYRLSVVTLSLPPLRKRTKDLAILTRHFIRQFNREYGKSVQDLSTELWDLVYRHHWPGNIRELRNFVQRVIIFSDGEIAGPDLLPEQYKKYSARELDSAVLYDELKGEAVKKSIMNALNKSQGSKGKAAELLGIDRKTLYNRMKKYELL